MLSAVVLGLVLAGGAATDSVAPDACPSRKPSGIEAFVVLRPVRIQARDTLIRATVCVARKPATKIGSYHGELTFDSTLARVVSVTKPPAGMRVENTTRKGLVKFAGANPSGFSEDALITVILRVRAPRAAETVQLKMLELNSVDGTDLMKQVVTTSAGRP
jgi:hypothetical protein